MITQATIYITTPSEVKSFIRFEDNNIFMGIEQILKKSGMYETEISGIKTLFILK